MKIRSLLQGKKRYVTAAVVAATLGGGAFAYAAGITVSSKSLGAGSSSVAACNSTTSVSYATSWDATNSQFSVKSVTVTSAAACNGMDVDAVITGTGNTPTAGTLPDDLGHQALNASGSYTWDLSSSVGTTSAVAAAAVTGVQVAITG